MTLSLLNPPSPYSAIIFDCDGTLVDSTRLYFRTWNNLFQPHGVEMPGRGSSVTLVLPGPKSSMNFKEHMEYPWMLLLLCTISIAPIETR